MRVSSLSRREFLTSVGAATVSLASRDLLGSSPRPSHSRAKPRVAAIFTEFRFRSHAFNFLENFLAPCLFSGKLTDPGVEVVSMYADQFPEGDMAREVSTRFQVPLFASIDEALCLGGRELAVDAVLSIVEHGNYPTNSRGQKMYPRKQFFDAAVAVMRRSGRYVPYFNDKHLSYRWDWAREMYDTARRCGFPLMAGSSVPLAERRPPVEVSAGSMIEEAVAIHGGGVEVYDFHSLELLQSFVEARRGGETGIACVEFLSGDDLWQTAARGHWSKELADAAMAAELGSPPADYAAIARDKQRVTPHGIQLTYRDGFRAIVLDVGRSSSRWNFAYRLARRTANGTSGRSSDSGIVATALYNGPWGNRCLFKALSHAVQRFFVTRCAPYPVERTLMVSGALDAAMTSRECGGPVRTRHLEFCYAPTEFTPFRETGESWRVLPPGTPEPTGFLPQRSQSQ